MAVVFIAIGSNLGDRAASLDRAVEMLSQAEGVRLAARSGNYETAPVGGPPGQGDYLNGALRIETELPPRRLLAVLQEIESRAGRPPLGQRVASGPRTIDLDILLYDDRVISEKELTLPHPRMHLRRFVLAPLAEIAADTRHPLMGATVREMLDWLGPPEGATA